MMFKFHKLLLFSAVAVFMLSCSGESTSVSEREEVKTPEQTEAQQQTEDVVVLFFGNSLTAAYGLDPEEGFTGLVQSKVDSLGWPVEMVNAGVTGETTATGRNRVDWVLERQRVDIFVLELGANDGLRGIPVAETERNLKAIIDKVREHHASAEIILAGMMVPPNMGEEYSADFQSVFPKVAEEKIVDLIPFLLKDVAGESDLNLEDGIHPNKKGHRIVANTIWQYLQPTLTELMESPEHGND